MGQSCSISIRWLVVACTALAFGCRGGSQPADRAERPSILLVTLDTTRADAIGPEASVATPAFNAVAGRGRLFRHALATAPETLPAHASLLTGLYPGGHGVHENARPLPRDRPLVAERLREAGYRTAAFVSSFVLARRFGLARGFEVYDDELPEGRVERSAPETTERAAAWLQEQPADRPLLLWVHYFEPHHPYEPPEPFRSRYPKSAYHAEVAAMDDALGRLVQAFDARTSGGGAILVVGDHGEGLSEHGEAQHGRLLYQSTMHVPLVLAGPGVVPGEADAPVSARRVFHTLLDWAGLGAESSLSRAVEIEPDNSLYQYAFGEMLRINKKYDEAIEAYRKATDLVPPHPKASSKLGLALFEAQRLGEAELFLTDAIRKDAKNPFNYYNLAIVYREQKKTKLAIEMYEKFLEIADKDDGDRGNAEACVKNLKRRRPCK